MDRSTEKFNGRKYGKYWNTIDFELATGGESTYTVNPGDKPTMGYLLIGNSRFPITESEANRLIETLEDAKQAALRSATEQAFGAFISSKAEMFNDQVVADQMASVSSGNIKSYEVLNESQLPDGSWGVTLKTIVSVDKLTSFVEAKGKYDS